MTTESSATERTGTAEDVERLAAGLMGWRPDFGVWRDSEGRVMADTAGREEWNPFLCAADDLTVLERVREVWNGTGARSDPVRMTAYHAALTQLVGASVDLGWALIFRYSVGDWSRAALAVL